MFHNEHFHYYQEKYGRLLCRPQNSSNHRVKINEIPEEDIDFKFTELENPQVIDLCTPPWSAQSEVVEDDSLNWLDGIFNAPTPRQETNVEDNFPLENNPLTWIFDDVPPADNPFAECELTNLIWKTSTLSPDDEEQVKLSGRPCI